jgi:hypothetical protein
MDLPSPARGTRWISPPPPGGRDGSPLPRQGDTMDLPSPARGTRWISLPRQGNPMDLTSPARGRDGSPFPRQGNPMDLTSPARGRSARSAGWGAVESLVKTVGILTGLRNHRTHGPRSTAHLPRTSATTRHDGRGKETLVSASWTAYGRASVPPTSTNRQLHRRLRMPGVSTCHRGRRRATCRRS